MAKKDSDEEKKIIDQICDNLIDGLNDSSSKKLPNAKLRFIKKKMKSLLSTEPKYYSGEKYELVNAARNNDLKEVKRLVEKLGVPINTCDDWKFYKDPIKESDIGDAIGYLQEAVLFYAIKNNNKEMIEYRLSKSPDLSLTSLSDILKPIFRLNDLKVIETMLGNKELIDMLSYDMSLHDYKLGTPTELEREQKIQEFKEKPIPTEHLFRMDHYISNTLDSLFIHFVIRSEQPDIKMAEVMMPHLISCDEHLKRVEKEVNFPADIIKLLKEKAQLDENKFKRNLLKKRTSANRLKR